MVNSEDLPYKWGNAALAKAVALIFPAAGICRSEREWQSIVARSVSASFGRQCHFQVIVDLSVFGWR